MFLINATLFSKITGSTTEETKRHFLLYARISVALWPKLCACAQTRSLTENPEIGSDPENVTEFFSIGIFSNVIVGGSVSDRGDPPLFIYIYI